MSNLKAPNEEQQKFLNELQADPKLGTKYTELLLFVVEVLASLSEVTRAAKREGIPEALSDAIVKMTAFSIADRTEEDFPHPEQDKRATTQNPVGVKLRHDIVHYLKLVNAIDPSSHWDDVNRKLVTTSD